MNGKEGPSLKNSFGDEAKIAKFIDHWSVVETIKYFV